jgi:hypothetical protein
LKFNGLQASVGGPFSCAVSLREFSAPNRTNCE